MLRIRHPYAPLAPCCGARVSRRPADPCRLETLDSGLNPHMAPFHRRQVHCMQCPVRWQTPPELASIVRDVRGTSSVVARMVSIEESSGIALLATASVPVALAFELEGAESTGSNNDSETAPAPGIPRPAPDRWRIGMDILNWAIYLQIGREVVRAIRAARVGETVDIPPIRGIRIAGQTGNLSGWSWTRTR